MLTSLVGFNVHSSLKGAIPAVDNLRLTSLPWTDKMATLPPGRLKPMTLLVGLRGADGLVVAADSRGTFGDPRGVTAQNDSQKKLYVTSKYSAVLTAGAGELGAQVMREVAGAIQNLEGVTAIMDAARNVVRTRYEQWFNKFSVQP